MNTEDKKPKKKVKRKEEAVGNMCPYCDNREFTSRWYLNEHIKDSHKKGSLI